MKSATKKKKKRGRKGIYNRSTPSTVKRWIVDKGWTLPRCAREIGIAEGTIRYWRRIHPEFDKAVREALNVRRSGHYDNKKHIAAGTKNLTSCNKGGKESHLVKVGALWHPPTINAKLRKYLSGHWQELGHATPSRVGFASMLKTDGSLVNKWYEEHYDDEYCRLIRRLDTERERVLVDNGLTGNFRDGFCRFILINRHNYEDKQKIETDQKIDQNVTVTVDDDLQELVGGTIELGKDDYHIDKPPDQDDPLKDMVDI